MTCLMTVRWHGMLTGCWMCILASWWCHPYPGLAHGSGRLVFGSSQLIRVKKTRGARLCAWAISTPARDGAWGGFQQWLRLFLLYTVVWSKHNFDKFHFWAKSNTPLNHVLWYQLLGILTGDVLIFAQRRLSTLTQYFTWFGKSPTSTGESQCIRGRERVTINTWRRRITQLSAHTLCCIWQQGCCPWQQLLFLSSSRHFTLTHSLSFFSQI